MAKYVDGFVLTVKKKDLAAYKKMAREGAKLWQKHGALEYKECVLEDKKPKGITLTFPKLAGTKPNEVVIFSYIVYKSRAHRDQVSGKVMADPAMDKYQGQPMPFDMKRMAYGGFEVLVEM
jgi:alkaline phosphatase